MCNSKNFIFDIVSKLEEVKSVVQIINQLHEMESKLALRASLDPVSRNIDRIKHHLKELGYSYHSPLNEQYTSERADCEAGIAGDANGESMYISKVIKPVIYQKSTEGDQLIQKAIVIVES